MLHLHSATTDRWLSQVIKYLNEILIDYIHCEQKAAAITIKLMFDGVEN